MKVAFANIASVKSDGDRTHHPNDELSESVRAVDSFKAVLHEELGNPYIGDIAWLITTQKGEEEAKRLLEERKKSDSK